MLEIKLTKEQVQAIIQIIGMAQISGKDAEFIVELKKVFTESLKG